MSNTYTATREEFVNSSKIPLRVMKSEAAIYEEMAQIMFDTIVKNKGELTVIICPVGPVGHYPIFAEKVNKARLSLKNCVFINMDEYLDESGELIPYEHPLSFRFAMDKFLYSRIDEELCVLPENRIFPEPSKEKEIDALIDSFAKVDLCLTGVGINGHIAFNEPPKEVISEEEFGNIGTRCLDIATETIVNNGSRKYGGALDAFPKRCITLGMRQLLKAEVLKVYLYCDWQWGIARKIALEDTSVTAPASFLQSHKNAEMIITEEIANFKI
ncbi:MAG: glucosamine-6-phosphate isomerase [Ruminococcaceae bacterium]|nr:glucosamine-6-phosphate isomerase [Oscillospiraceae bacterium]